MAATPDLDPPTAASAARAADSWLAFRRERERVPGVQAAVSLGGQLLLSTAHGTADESTGEALTTAHLFRVASHSKTFTATAVLRLAAAGRLRLEDPLSRCLPALADAPAGALPLSALLSHSSGLTRDGARADHWQRLQPFPDAAQLLAVLADPASAVIGAHERFKYSNTAYGALGLVVEAVTGRSYGEHLQADVIDRLGLRDTHPTWRPELAGRHAGAHTALAYADARVVIPPVDTRALDAATGFSSTAADLCAWADAHSGEDDRLLPATWRRLAQHQAWPVDADAADEDPGARADAYGLGSAITWVGERRLLGHGGGFPGHSTQTLFDPRARLAVSVLTNAIDGPARSLARGVVSLVDLAARGEPDPGLLALPDDLAASLTGRFADLWRVRDVVRLGDRLVSYDPGADDPAQGAVELRVEDPGTLRVVAAPGYGAPGEAVRYDRDDAGRVRAVRGPGGITSWPWRDWVGRRGWEQPADVPGA